MHFLDYFVYFQDDGFVLILCKTDMPVHNDDRHRKYFKFRYQSGFPRHVQADQPVTDVDIQPPHGQFFKLDS